MKRLPQGKKAEPPAKEAARMLLPWRDGVLTITTDNGGEFACHALIVKSLRRKGLNDIAIYFTDPYASWQKGAVENANGLIRQYIPKGVSFNNFTDEQINEIQRKLNRRPREKLNFTTPIAAFNKFFVISHPPVDSAALIFYSAGVKILGFLSKFATDTLYMAIQTIPNT